MVSVRWTGAAGLEFTHDGRTWLIDPYYTRSGMGDVLFGRLTADVATIRRRLRELPGELSAVIAGHSHFDHIADIPTISDDFDGPILGNSSLETAMKIHERPGRVRVCTGRERVDLPGGAVLTMIPSRHGKVVFGRVPYPGEIDPATPRPFRARDYRHGQVFSPHIEVGGVRFVQIGSADVIDDELAPHPADVVFLCVPGWKHCPDYAARVIRNLKPKVVIPFHFDDFTKPFDADGRAPSLPFQGIDAFIAKLRAEANGIEIRVIHTYETLRF